MFSEEEKEEYLGIVDYLFESHPHEKIHTIFEMSIDMGDNDWDYEDEFGELFDDYTNDIPKSRRYFRI